MVQILRAKKYPFKHQFKNPSGELVNIDFEPIDLAIKEAYAKIGMFPPIYIIYHYNAILKMYGYFTNKRNYILAKPEEVNFSGCVNRQIQIENAPTRLNTADVKECAIESYFDEKDNKVKYKTIENLLHINYYQGVNYL